VVRKVIHGQRAQTHLAGRTRMRTTALTGREPSPACSRPRRVQFTVTTNGFGVVFSGVNSDGQGWFPSSNVAAQPIV
jgi:hypothetical protein